MTDSLLAALAALLISASAALIVARLVTLMDDADLDMEIEQSYHALLIREVILEDLAIPRTNFAVDDVTLQFVIDGELRTYRVQNFAMALAPFPVSDSDIADIDVDPEEVN